MFVPSELDAFPRAGHLLPFSGTTQRWVCHSFPSPSRSPNVLLPTPFSSPRTTHHDIPLISSAITSNCLLAATYRTTMAFPFRPPFFPGSYHDFHLLSPIPPSGLVLACHISPSFSCCRSRSEGENLHTIIVQYGARNRQNQECEEGENNSRRKQDLAPAAVEECHAGLLKAMVSHFSSFFPIREMILPFFLLLAARFRGGGVCCGVWQISLSAHVECFASAPVFSPCSFDTPSTNISSSVTLLLLPFVRRRASFSLFLPALPPSLSLSTKDIATTAPMAHRPNRPSPMRGREKRRWRLTTNIETAVRTLLFSGSESSARMVAV